MTPLRSPSRPRSEAVKAAAPGTARGRSPGGQLWGAWPDWRSRPVPVRRQRRLSGCAAVGWRRRMRARLSGAEKVECWDAAIGPATLSSHVAVALFATARTISVRSASKSRGLATKASKPASSARVLSDARAMPESATSASARAFSTPEAARAEGGRPVRLVVYDQQAPPSQAWRRRQNWQIGQLAVQRFRCPRSTVDSRDMLGTFAAGSANLQFPHMPARSWSCQTAGLWAGPDPADSAHSL